LIDLVCLLDECASDGQKVRPHYMQKRSYVLGRIHRSICMQMQMQLTVSVCRRSRRSVVCMTVLSPSKTAEPIETPFGLWTQVGPKNRVLDGGPDLLFRDNIKWVRGGQLWNMGTLCRELFKNGWTDRGAVWDVDSDGIRWGSYCRHLVNTIERSTCSADAAFCQTALTTCLI